MKWGGWTQAANPFSIVTVQWLGGHGFCHPLLIAHTPVQHQCKTSCHCKGGKARCVLISGCQGEKPCQVESLAAMYPPFSPEMKKGGTKVNLPQASPCQPPCRGTRGGSDRWCSRADGCRDAVFPYTRDWTLRALLVHVPSTWRGTVVGNKLIFWRW